MVVVYYIYYITLQSWCKPFYNWAFMETIEESENRYKDVEHFDILISQDKYKSRKKSNPFMELAPIEGDTEMETEESENKKNDSKDMENTNRGNKSMSIDNFMTVLHNSGEIICNLGFIYLLQFNIWYFSIFINNGRFI